MSKGLSRPLRARCAKLCRLSGRFGGASPTGDPATEPSGSRGGRERSDFWQSGNTQTKAQRLPQVNSPKPPPTGPTPLPPAPPHGSETCCLKSLKNHFKFQLGFETAFGTVLGSQKAPKMAPKATPRASQDALGARWPLGRVLGAVFGAFLEPPESQKSSSRLGAVLLFAKIALRAREPKIDPKMSPKWHPKCSPEAPRMTKIPLQSAT